jgi:hypothetical protein
MKFNKLGARLYLYISEVYDAQWYGWYTVHTAFKEWQMIMTDDYGPQHPSWSRKETLDTLLFWFWYDLSGGCEALSPIWSDTYTFKHIEEEQ